MTSADSQKEEPEEAKEEGKGFRPSLRWYLVLAVLVGMSGWMLLRPPPQTNAISSFEGETMGTPYVVRLAPVLSDADLTATQRAVEVLMHRLDRELWSTFAEDSELSTFNRHVSTDPLEVSESTAALVQRALRIAEASEGRFDPTVAPLVRAFGFGADAEEEVPSEETLAALRAQVGHGQLTVTSDPPRLQKHTPLLTLDLGGIAKGQVVDEVLALLRARHPDHAIMVEIGGEVCAHGHKPDGSPWRIGIQDPRTAMPRIWRAVPLENRCMATSGDYRQFREIDGQQVGHTMDPEAGTPRRGNLASVTVFADQCADADAWATALLVAGAEDAERLNPHPALLLIGPEGDGGNGPESDAADEELELVTLDGPQGDDPAAWLGRQ